MNYDRPPVKVFVSYSQSYDNAHTGHDWRIVLHLTEDLQEQGIKIVTYLDKFRPGTNEWKQSMKEIIREAVAVLCLVSPDTSETNDVSRELEFLELNKRPVYLVWIAGDDWDALVPEKFKGQRYFDLRDENYRRGLSELAAVLRAQHVDENWHDMPGPDMPSVPQRMKQPSAIPRSYLVPSAPNSVTSSFPKFIQWFEKALSYFGFRVSRRVSGGAVTTTAGQKTERREPYKGLLPFTGNDAKYFFGRDQLIEEIVDRIIQLAKRRPDAEPALRFLNIVGSSGSGKSSLVMAGVIPRLQRRDRHWLCLTPVRPGVHPLGSLAHVLAPELPNKSEEALLKSLQSNPKSLKTNTESISTGKGRKLVLYIDQFEELFTMGSEEEERRQFIDLLESVANDSNGRVFVIITLRADFYDRFLDNNRLAVMLGPQTISVPAMSISQLRETIEKPAQLVQVEVEGDLVDELLNDIAQQRDALPLLQFTLKKLYDQSDRYVLTMQAYRELRGVSGALDSYANDIYLGKLQGQSLTSDRQRDMARSLFCSLININDSVENATRRRATASDFLLPRGEDRQVMEETIEIFINARLLTTDRPMKQLTVEGEDLKNSQEENTVVSEEKTLEICHEALIREWQLLRDWVGQNQDGMRVQQNLIIDSNKWEDNGEPKNLLYSGKELKKARTWADKNKPTVGQMKFLRKSRRRQNRNLSIIAGLVIVILVLLGVLIRAFINYKVASGFSSNNIVSNTDDNGLGSLRQVLNSASDGSEIHFESGLHGRITLSSGDLVFGRNVTISVPKQEDIEISSAKSFQDHIVISKNVSVTFENLVFADAFIYSSSFIANQGNLTLNNCYLHDNQTVNNGGGVANFGGTLTLLNTRIVHNKASGNGGGIYNQGGEVTINNSTIHDNTSNHGGGGIYSLQGDTVVDGSHIQNNHALGGDGGGIDVLDGLLTFTTSDAKKNDSSTYGGGIAVVGSQAAISAANIINNIATLYGGGLAVVKDSENNTPALVATDHVDLTGNTKARYTILQNHVRQPLKTGQRTLDILGVVVSSRSKGQISSDSKNYKQGSPAPEFSPELNLGSKYYLGTVDLDTFCQSQSSSYGTLSEDKELTATDIQIKCLNQSGDVSGVFNALATCQQAYPHNQDVLDRMADYNDQSTLQCYRNVKILGPIMTVANVQRFCQSMYHTDVDNSTPRVTAYDWKCKQRKDLSTGFGVTDVCQFIYNKNPRAFDRLLNYYRPDGWECLAPQ